MERLVREGQGNQEDKGEDSSEAEGKRQPGRPFAEPGGARAEAGSRPQEADREVPGSSRYCRITCPHINGLNSMFVTK